MSEEWLEQARPLLESPAAAVLTTSRRNGSPLVSPVWFRWRDAALEVVIAEGDPKLRHLRRDPRCVLVVFETSRPFRGLELRGAAELCELDVGEIRAEIAGRYLGAAGGERFAAARRAVPGVLLRLPLLEPRVWDLAAILPA